MNPLIERAVAALFVELRAQESDDTCAFVGDVLKEGSAIFVDGDVDLPRLVRAVLTAIREPTDEMINHLNAECARRQAHDDDSDTVFIYQTMIDAALKEDVREQIVAS